MECDFCILVNLMISPKTYMLFLEFVKKAVLKGNVLQMMVEIVLEAFQSSESEVYLDDLGVEHLLMGLENVKDLHHDERAVKQKILYSSRSLKDILAIVNELVETSKIGEDDI